VRRSWFAGDLRRLDAAWAGPPEDFPGKYPSVVECLGDMVLRGGPDFVFRWSDPLPFVAEFVGRLGW
jgi:hypothetical protein